MKRDGKRWRGIEIREKEGERERGRKRERERVKGGRKGLPRAASTAQHRW
jgi:hypothetical protein